jgi:HTH-type transcriptional regulator, transcriptional repressor of NAD biosynthesis genes
MSNGIVIGRFMPLHAGHVALIRTALALVDHLTIMICAMPGDTPDGVSRLRWMMEMFPATRIVVAPAPSPHAAPDGAEARAEWAARIADFHPAPIDQLFASDNRQGMIAAAIGARLVLIDPRREGVPLRSSRVRVDPFAFWRLIPPAVRPSYAHTICLHGPESTGKSMLAAALARHFYTVFVPEYGRTYCEQFGTDLAMGDLVTIGRTHAALTQAMLRQCNARLILDTDPLMTAVWADMMFGKRDPWFDEFSATAKLYLLLDIDMPFVDDGLRVYGGDAERRRFFDLSRAELERRGVPYAVINGPAEARFIRALEAIAAAGL